jgi:hypothetical protein
MLSRPSSVAIRIPKVGGDTSSNGTGRKQCFVVACILIASPSGILCQKRRGNPRTTSRPSCPHFMRPFDGRERILFM